MAGLAVVVAAVALGRWWARRSPGDAVVDATDVAAVVTDDEPDQRLVVVRLLRALGGLAIRLPREYLLLVVALGAFRGVLLPVGASWLPGTGVVLAVVGVAVLAVAVGVGLLTSVGALAVGL